MYPPLPYRDSLPRTSSPELRYTSTTPWRISAWPVCQRVCRTPEHSRVGNDGSNAVVGSGNGRQETSVPGHDRKSFDLAVPQQPTGFSPSLLGSFNRVEVRTEPPEYDPMGEPNWKNRTLFHSDNLPILRAMNSETVDLIATDPPFNKSRDFHATPDSLAAGASFQDRWSWERDVHQDWTDQITDDLPKLMEAIESARYAHSDGMGAFMCFMAVRLMEMRRVLKPAGSIYLHCDPTASHYLKAVMDAVFGWKNFRNEIVWGYRTGGVGKRWFARKHDTILFYSKSKSFLFNVQHYRSYQQKKYNYNPKYPELWDKGRKQWYHNSVCRDVWEDIKAIGTEKGQKEVTGYPTQKPLALYERIIKAGSDEGGMVLDPFAGCATTLVAAEKLHRQWAGIDIWDDAIEVVLQRLEREGLIVSDTTDGLHGNLFPDNIIPTDKFPERTDTGEYAAPNLRTKVKVFEPRGPKMSRADMYKYLLDQHGMKCQGCDRVFDDPRYLQLDHNTPRSDGGLNHISNRVLLCGPCNRLKSNVFTLSGLRRENKRRGYMYGVDISKTINQRTRASDQ